MRASVLCLNNMKDIKNLDKEYIVNSYKRNDLLLVQGMNATAIDEKGKEYIDFTSGIGVNSLGFCNQKWARAVAKQAKTLNHTSNLFYTKSDALLAEKLCKKTKYARVFFGNSGAEANECAIKVARKYSFDKYNSPERTEIITLVNSFHGRTMATLSATGQDNYHNYFYPFLNGFRFVPANDYKALQDSININTCAVMLELVQGEGGVLGVDKEYVDKVSRLCARLDLVLIIDEVQTGVGRTGTFLAQEQYEVKADIVTLAKGLGGGLPIGACLLNKKLKDVLTFGTHGSTFGGNPIVCAGAIEVLKQLNKSMLDEVKEKGKLIKDTLLKSEEVESVSGLGMMIGVKLKTKTAADVIKACMDKGLLLLSAKDKIRLLPPLTISENELNKGLEILLGELNNK